MIRVVSYGADLDMTDGRGNTPDDFAFTFHAGLKVDPPVTQEDLDKSLEAVHKAMARSVWETRNRLLREAGRPTE